jgi:hypothetical protein
MVLCFGVGDAVTELVVLVRPAPAALALALGEAILSHLSEAPRPRPDELAAKPNLCLTHKESASSSR